MATGTVSSQQTTNRAAVSPVAAIAPVLRSGEKMASTAEALKNPNAKVFYHQVAGAKFIMPDGLELQFLGGRLVTDDETIIAELSKIANKSTSLITTDRTLQGVVTQAQDKAAADASDTAGK